MWYNPAVGGYIHTHQADFNKRREASIPTLNSADVGLALGHLGIAVLGWHPKNICAFFLLPHLLHLSHPRRESPPAYEHQTPRVEHQKKRIIPPLSIHLNLICINPFSLPVSYHVKRRMNGMWHSGACDVNWDLSFERTMNGYQYLHACRFAWSLIYLFWSFDPIGFVSPKPFAVSSLAGIPAPLNTVMTAMARSDR